MISAPHTIEELLSWNFPAKKLGAQCFKML